MIQWFDDLTVGMRYKGGEAEVARDDIKRFAAEFDPQPFHLDAGGIFDEAAGSVLRVGRGE